MNSANCRSIERFLFRFRVYPRSSAALPFGFQILAAALGICLASLVCGSSASASEFVFYHENVMGTALELRVQADTPSAARWAEAQVLGEIDRLSAIFSGYDPSSEFSRWQASFSGPRKVSAELFEVLQESDRWRSWSGGAFDPRVEALTRLWSQCAKGDRVPKDVELAAAQELMSREAWRLDSAARTAERRSTCPLSLNGIAKGFIAERASAVALDRGQGVHGLLLNVGGDMRVCGDFARTIGILPPGDASEAAEPFTSYEVRDQSVATSGNTHRGLEIQGRWYSHIFDPRSGKPVERTVSATVIARRGADADALAKVFSVLPVEESLRLADTLPDVACLLVTSDGQVSRSQGWQRYATRPAAVNLALALADKAKPATDPSWWANENEVLIKFEINCPQAESGRYRRPYVAVWVEDANGVEVRTLVIWVSMGGSGPDQWLPDLRRFYRDDPGHTIGDKKALVYSYAQPTRNPGTYSVIWDGKDDRGKPVPNGEYTIFLEAAREHGTYQSMRKRLTLPTQPFVEVLKGNVELKSATIEYRRKTPAK
jgi:thiamine biosynthesis lipoprotein ApbE